MKTIRDYINLIETAQTPVAEGQATRTCPQCDGSGEDTLDPTKSCRRCSGKGYIPMPKEQGVAEGATVDYKVEWTDRNTGEQGLTTVSALTSQDAADKLVKMKLQQLDNVDVTDVFPAHNQNPVAEAVGRKDLISRLQKDLPRIDDPKNKDAEPVKWTGPKKGDYGYTGYQGHGMPTDKAERDRIRADKKKGLPEDEATARMGLMSAMGSNDNNPADQRRAMAQQAVEQLASKK